MGNLLQYMYAKTVITDKVLTKLLQLKWCSFFASHTGQVVHIRSAVIGSLRGARRSSAAARRILVHFSFKLDIANHSLFVSRRLLEEHGKAYSKSSYHFLRGQSYWHSHQPKHWRNVPPVIILFVHKTVS